MTIINSTSLLSGLAVQQMYKASESVEVKTSGSSAGPFVSPSGDTVQISERARELFRSQSSGNGTEATGETPGIFSDSTPIEDQISQLEAEISGLLAEIALLEEKAGTDDLAAILLRSKQAQLLSLQAKLLELRTESLL